MARCSTLTRCAGRIHALAAVPSADQLLVCTSHGPIKLLEIATGTTVRKFDGHAAYEVSCSRFTADGKRSASCGGDRTLRIWDASTGKQVGLVEGFPDGLTSIIITPDDKHVLAAGGGRYPDSLDYTIRLWSIEGHRAAEPSIGIGARVVSGPLPHH